MIDRQYFEGYDRLMRRWHGGIDETIIDALCLRCESYPEAYFATHLDLILGLIEMGDLEDARVLIAKLAENGYWLDDKWIAKHLVLDDEVLAHLARNRNRDPDDPHPMRSLKRATHPTDRLAVVFHGWGQTPDLMQYHLEVPALTTDYDRLYLRSPDRLGSALYHWPETSEIAGRMPGLIDQVLRDYRELLFIGFGQGGELAMRLALSATYPQARFLAIAPTIPALGALGTKERESLLVSGKEDPLHASHRELVDAVNAAGVPLAHKWVPEMGHYFPEETTEIMEAFLNR